MMLSIIQANDVYHLLSLLAALFVGMFFGLERSYRGKINALTVYTLITMLFSGVTVGIQYIYPTVDPIVTILLFIALIFVVFLVHQWKKENMDDFSCASLLVSGTLGILLALKQYIVSLYIFAFVVIIYTIVYLLNIYIERRRYALTIIVEKENNILLKVLEICDVTGAKIKKFTSSVIILEGKESLRLEVVFNYGTSKKKVRKVFEELKNEKPINLVFHGDIHKMEWH